MSSVEECMTESWEDHGGVVLYMFICMYVFYGFEVRIYCVWQIVLFFFFFSLLLSIVRLLSLPPPFTLLLPHACISTSALSQTSPTTIARRR